MIDLPLSTSGAAASAVALRTVKEAGTLLLEHFHKEKRVSYKGRTDLVTDIDVLAERNIIASLEMEYPGWGILGEESKSNRSDSPYTWIIDPLDGTRNYALGLPLFSVVLALTKGDDVLLGLIYDPLNDEVFSAQKGQGAYLNGSPITVSKKKTLQEAALGLDLGYVDEKAKRTLKLVSELWPGMQSIRIMGSGALGMAYAACGRFDLYFHPLLYPWEVACGKLLVTEAGGVITDWEGKPLTSYETQLVASNAAIHAEFIKRIEEVSR